MSYPIFRGSIVAIITPLDENGNVDYASLQNLVEYHVQSGTSAIVACGTTGEAVTLTEEESLEVIRKVVEFANKRVPVIAGTGSNCTAKAIAYTKKVEALGVDACLTVVPYYNKPNQEGLYQHFKAIAESTALPQILYNVPGRTVVSLDVDTIVRLAQLPNVIAIKDAHPDLHRVGEIVSRTKEFNFVHLSGEDPTALDAIALGSNGVVSVSANVIAKEWAQIVETALNGDYAKALELNRQYANVHTSLFIEPNPTPAKWIAYKLGLIKTPNQRLPLVGLSEAGQEKLTKVLTAAKVFK
ncbi:4-hydroxy-tetrahydrodipicolinate synthase [Psittacicella gerlachiana]|uniref:4-hydroxy-tetrahydrodipicolinate synthase n=1 Tax=Psittacicella gerlachiana TaxID=2028574 RepID=A0A3A1YQZ4_9GAMM|nr:4-hydroxy-tetrahydrodipicolinate synthase [Psittacicella gerlachiana]RIY38457.1 4-hydroxy-tetrahydrodipicolinate synthase [Psittacicella gerlachiana]